MKAFLDETNAFLDSITGYFHLINTSRTALRALTDKVRILTDAGADDKVISALFPLADKTTGQNLRAYAHEDEIVNNSKLAEMWLFAVFARYESWATAIGTNYNIERSKRGCQFPGPSDRGDYQSVFGSLPVSEPMVAIFGAARDAQDYISSDESTVEALHIYRYYKEVRNVLIHSGGGESLDRMNSAFTRAESAYETLASTGDRVVQLSPVDINNMGLPCISFEFVRDVIWLVQKLAATIDLKILLSERGSSLLINRWESVHGSSPMKLRQKTRTSGKWYMHNVSTALSLPHPPNPRGGYWPLDARNRFFEFGSDRGLLRMV